MELREKILNSAITAFGEKGLKLTMDDVAKGARISKKTLYNVFWDKEDLFFALTDYYFSEMKAQERAIMEDDSLDTLEKLRRLIVVQPERYKSVGLSKLYQLRDRYPETYQRVANYLETDWDSAITLFKRGMEEGVLRKMSIPVVKAMVEGTIQRFLASSILVEYEISFEDALQEMIDVIMDGITVRE